MYCKTQYKNHLYNHKNWSKKHLNSKPNVGISIVPWHQRTIRFLLLAKHGRMGRLPTRSSRHGKHEHRASPIALSTRHCVDGSRHSCAELHKDMTRKVRCLDGPFYLMKDTTRYLLGALTVVVCFSSLAICLFGYGKIWLFGYMAAWL